MDSLEEVQKELKNLLTAIEDFDAVGMEESKERLSAKWGDTSDVMLKSWLEQLNQAIDAMDFDTITDMVTEMLHR